MYSKLKYQTVVVPLLTALERKTQALHEDGETPVQTDVLLYVSHTLLMVGILEEVCPLHHPHLLPPGALAIYSGRSLNPSLLLIFLRSKFHQRCIAMVTRQTTKDRQTETMVAI